MPVDTSIYGNLLQAPKSAAEYGAELDRADLARGQLATQRLNLIGAQQEYDDSQKLRSLYSRPDFDPMAASSLKDIYAISPKAGASAQKTQLDTQKTQADIKHVGAQTDQALAAAEKTKIEHAIAVQAQIAQAAGAATDQASWERGLQIAKTLGADISKVPPQFNPATAKAIHDQALTGAQQLDAHFKQITATETNRHNTASEANTVRGQDVSAKTSRDNNAATIAKDYKVAGLDSNGNFAGIGPDGAPGGASPLAGLIDAIGSGKVDEKTALARTPPPLKAQILAGVQAKYPEYDPSTYAAKVKAARDFTSGTQGNALRSFAVAGQHLDQLGTLVDALDNGNYQIVNKIGNAYSAQTGSTAPTNFDAAKDVVSKEVTKAIVAGGGGVAERAELANLMSNAKSPAQLKGVITQYRGLMSAQHDALLQQRRGAGLPDSTLPAYSRETAAALPPDIAAIVARHKDK